MKRADVGFVCARAVGLVVAFVLAVAPGRSARAEESVAPSGATSEAAPDAVVDRQEVFDFCFMKIPKNAGRSAKQRLVLFRLAGRDIALGPEHEVTKKGKEKKGIEHHVFRDAGIESHLHEAFVAAMLIKRFYTVEAEIESPASLKRRPALSDREMIQAAGTDSFAAYSLACADWVAMPRLVKKEASFRQVKKTKQVNGRSVEYQAWDLDIEFTLEADLYRHEGNGWQLARTIEGSNGSFLGAAFELAAAAPQRGQGFSPAKLVSKRPAPGCRVPLISELSDFGADLSSCTGGAEALATAAQSALKGESAPQASAAESHADPTSGTSGTSNAPRTGPVTPGASDLGAGPSKVGDVAETAAGELVAEAVPLTSEERALLTAVAGGDKLAAKRLAALAPTAKNPSVLSLAATAKGTVGACVSSVESVAKASERLRALSQQGPAAIGVQSLVGLAGCAGARFDADLSSAYAPGTQQAHTRYCQGLKDDVSLGSTAMQDVALCRGRVAMERAGLALQNQAKQLRGIKLYAQLQALPGHGSSLYGLALGQDEGVERGDVYVTLAKGSGDDVETVGFGRVQFAGPGGDRGELTPSHFRMRSGMADAGVSVEEHAQIGVPLGARPAVQYYVFKGDLATTLAFGGAIEGGYNATKFVPFGDEVWGRASLGFTVGEDEEVFMTVDLVPEVQYYLVGGLAVYGSTGLAFVVANKTIEPERGGTSENATGYTIAALAKLGLDYALNPDWNARIGVAYRQGLKKAELQNESKTLKVDGGTLSAAEGSVALGYTF